MDIMRKIIVALIAILFLSIAARSQTVLVNRSFNPSATCTDPPNVIINQMNPSFTQGWYKCVSSVYVVANINTASPVPTAYTCSACAANGITNDSTAYQAMIDAAPNGALIYDPPGAIYRLNSTINIHLRKSLTFTSFLSARNFSTFVPQYVWGGSVAGKMFNVQSSQDIIIEGHLFKSAGPTVKYAVSIDGEGEAQISTANIVRLNSFDFFSQSLSTTKLVAISETAGSNNENMEVSQNDFYCSGGARATANGVGIFNSASPNAKHQIFNDNNIANCAIGLYVVGGSVKSISGLGASDNQVTLQIDGLTEPLTVDEVNAEHSAILIKAASIAPLTFTNIRCNNDSQTNTGGFIQVTGKIFFEQVRCDTIPPVGGTIYQVLPGSDPNALDFHSKHGIYTDGSGVLMTMAQVGYAAFLSGGNYTKVTSDFDSGISDGPCKGLPCRWSTTGFFSFPTGESLPAVAWDEQQQTYGVFGGETGGLLFGNNETILTYNAYWNGAGWKFIAADTAAQRLFLDAGSMTVQISDDVGVADGPISWLPGIFTAGAISTGNISTSGNTVVAGSLTAGNISTSGNTVVAGSLTGNTLSIASGVTNNVGMQHVRVTTGSISGASSALITVSWGTAFPDLNYTPVCSMVDSTASTLSLSVVHIESKGGSSIAVRVNNTAAGALTGTLQCIAMHD